jgi:hypothetical protein
MGCHGFENDLWGPSSYFMVTKCPKEYKYQEFKDKCNSSVYDNPADDNVTVAPVTDGVFSYKNAYCAWCHNVDIETLKMWITEYRCKVGSNPKVCKYVVKTPKKNSLIFGSLAVRLCPYQYSKPWSPNFTYECPKRYSPHHALDTDLCEGPYHIPVSNGPNHVFKNIYCVLCNGETIRNTKCEIRGYEIIDVIDIQEIQSDHFVSFRVLLDFDRLKASTCSDSELYDREMHKCQAVSCRDGFAFFKGYCRKVLYLMLNIKDDIQEGQINLQSLWTRLSVRNEQTFYFTDKRLDNVDNRTALTVSLVSKNSEQIEHNDLKRFVRILKTPLINQTESFQSKSRPISGFVLSSHPLDYLANCTLKQSTLLNDLNGESFINITTFWMITGKKDSLVKKAFLCVNGSGLSCPNVLYPKEQFRWQNGAPDVGNALTLTQDMLEVVDDHVFICIDALAHKWTLFRGYDTDDSVQGILTMVGSSLSLAGLGYTIPTYSLLPSLRTLPGKMLMNLYCVALFL